MRHLEGCVLFNKNLLLPLLSLRLNPSGMIFPDGVTYSQCFRVLVKRSYVPSHTQLVYSRCPSHKPLLGNTEMKLSRIS